MSSSTCLSRLQGAILQVQVCIGRWGRLWRLLLLLLVIGLPEFGCVTPGGDTFNDRTGGGEKLVEVVLISNQENTRFRVKEGNAVAFRDLGTGKILTVWLPATVPLEISAKPRGYCEKSFTVISPNKQIQFFFLKEDKQLIIQSDHENTHYRIRKAKDSHWLELRDAGKEIEYPVPHEGSFEIEASPPGCFPKIEPVIDPMGELTFADFVQTRMMELVSNRDFTRFLIRKLGQGETEWEYLGVGRTLSICVPAAGAFEISAQPIYYKPKQRTLNGPQEKLSFEFLDEDMSHPPPDKPPEPQRTAIIPRPAANTGKLTEEQRAAVGGRESWCALLIGINDYGASGGKCPDLATPVNDTSALAEMLKDKYGFERVEILTNGNATLDGVRNKLFEINNNSERQQNILIYYAGHGILSPNGAGEWICADGRELVNAEIKDFLQRFQARRVLLISDSCFSGEFLKRDLPIRFEPVPPTPEEAVEISKDIVQNLNPSRQVLTSGQLDTVSDNGTGYCHDHSPFACHLLDTLEAVRPGAVISAMDLQANVAEAFRAAGVPENKLPQLGALEGDAGGEFFLIRSK